MQNTGNMLWNRTSVQLGAVGDSTGDAALFGSTRYRISTGASVSANSSYTWTFTMTAPTTSGTYHPSYQLINSSSVWFGKMVNTTIVVTNASIKSHTFNLTKGWNLISVPLDLQDSSIQGIFPDDVRSGIVDIWGWDASIQDWKYYSPDKDDYFYQYYPGITNIETGMAYWVEMNKSVSFTIQGTVPDDAPYSSESLVSGWNFIGSTGISSPAPSSLYSNAMDVWGWDESRQDWVYYSPDPNDYFYQYYPSIDNVQAGHGYWVELP